MNEMKKCTFWSEKGCSWRKILEYYAKGQLVVDMPPFEVCKEGTGTYPFTLNLDKKKCKLFSEKEDR